jgi:hypothetical protein
LDVVEEFAILCVFKDDEDVTGGVNKFKVLDNVWMVEAAQNFDLPLHLFEDALTLDLALVQNLDGNLVLCHLILSQLYFAKSSIAEIPLESVVSNFDG